MTVIPFLFGVFIGVVLHHVWLEYQYRKEVCWFETHPEEVKMYLRTMARRN